MRSFDPRALLLGCLALVGTAACEQSSGPGGAGGSSGGSGGQGGSTGGAGGSGLVPGTDAAVTPFDETPVYFTGADNQRFVDASATFPDEGLYSQIVLHLTLACPSGGCDPWDRFGSLGVVTAPGATPEEDEVIEIARFITPFGVGGSWDIDVTDLRPLLSGDVTLQAFIDTWVGPGSPYGDGWLLTASFEMTGGIPAKIPVAAIPIWRRSYVVYGDPAKPIEGSALPQDVTLPAASSWALRTFVTGHGQGNAQNCAEFCGKTHTVTVGATAHDQEIWRTDCAETAVPGQMGTFQYSRAGWCPGADVFPWTLDVTADVAGGSSITIGYGVEDYVNTCRPDSPMCQGCTLGTGCDYDGGAHTEPNFQLSSLLVAYE